MFSKKLNAWITWKWNIDNLSFFSYLPRTKRNSISFLFSSIFFCFLDSYYSSCHFLLSLGVLELPAINQKFHAYFYLKLKSFMAILCSAGSLTFHMIEKALNHSRWRVGYWHCLQVKWNQYSQWQRSGDTLCFLLAKKLKARLIFPYFLQKRIPQLCN